MSTKLIIIGGVAGGATAAARARRLDEHARIIIFERGEFVSFANCGLPYYIGGTIRERGSLLVTTSAAFSTRYNIDIRTFSEVTGIDRQGKAVEVRNLLTGETYRETYDKLILSPGAEPILPPIEGIDGENVFRLRTIPDADRIKARVESGNPGSAVIVGGGFIGIEMAENLVQRGVKTTILEKLDQILPPLDPEMAAIVQDALEEQGVVCELGNGLKAITRKGDRLAVETEKGIPIECDMLILSVGIRPENRLAKEAGLTLCEKGHIWVNPAMQTSDPDIYAVGDAVCTRDFVLGIPTATALAGPANKQARIAADNAMGRSSTFPGTLGTAILKVFNLTAASTGANEKLLLQNKIPYLVSYTHSGSHASYYPGAEQMAIKLLFSPDNGRILGGQIVGGGGVDKRIDVLATALHGGMRVSDLEELELAYAPPYSSAKDPVNIAGFAAGNILKGDMEAIFWRELPELNEDHVLLDLRESSEIKASGMIPGAVHISLRELRKRLPELDKTKTYVVYCAVGMRGYIAHRILAQHGFTSKNLSGGFKTYSSARGNR
ncbi:MAG TPA: FAD-dependent oxidoreductase [Deltaproteobacteria bacterium]|nr:FAD-dependent oxidoreductase [Deltaproteobacteria bacterium]HQI00072.1 FAD-dependent oxidoreductase [Deltaproteobacteria bacterium]HQJ09117.1 FAD-dependent oxidoreductase [Deltaproteobacteria bacterium]